MGLSNRGIDCAIAEHVMGWEVWSNHLGHMFAGDMLIDGVATWPDDRVFSPSTDIRAAWAVVEKICSREYYGQLSLKLCEGTRHYCTFHICTEEYRDGKTFKAWSDDSAPMAICLAALKALGVEVPDASTM